MWKLTLVGYVMKRRFRVYVKKTWVIICRIFRKPFFCTILETYLGRWGHTWAGKDILG